jgi:hypothetical protein
MFYGKRETTNFLLLILIRLSILQKRKVYRLGTVMVIKLILIRILLRRDDG